MMELVQPATRRLAGGLLPRLAPVWLALLTLTGCASLPTVRTVQPSFTLTDTADTSLGRSTAQRMGELQGPSGIHLLPRGPGAFLARVALVEAAERSLDIQYYIWQNDRVGKLLLAAVLRAAGRGVRVRILVDDIGSAPKDSSLLIVDAHPNIEVRLFNPAGNRTARGFWVVTDFSRVNRRMHNKSLTADNQVTIVGGRNIGDEYFEAGDELDYADLDAVAIGAAVPDVSSRFDRYWNSPVVYGITELHKSRATPEQLASATAALLEFERQERDRGYAQAMRDSQLAQEMRAGKVSFTAATIRVKADDPAKVEEPGKDLSKNLMPQLAPEFTATQDVLVLVSPYFVPGKGGVQLLRDMRGRGVRVKILTNGLASTDELPVFGKYKKYRRPLLEAGVELYEVNPEGGHEGPAGPLQTADRVLPAGSEGPRAALHGKVLVFDCREFFVGSMNLDPRSARINTEIGFLVDAPHMASQLCGGLDRTFSLGAYRVELRQKPGGDAHLEWVGKDDGQVVRLTGEPHSSWWQRFKAWFYGILPIESQM
jgi:putative cardiolipin synthase